MGTIEQWIWIPFVSILGWEILKTIRLFLKEGKERRMEEINVMIAKEVQGQIDNILNTE